ncbi:uncharacterized protein BO95DRAFT_494934 [Aspergillus brunneoviolaceus CBS 621.78]|uniref:Uncharacterized protein n=1 Tax=Aspergillus brunneoviolaceus CBS 621.78 TaxID=1450534 RepID=A0ACD1GAV4_9EURO|nr:hypothetical protein BO95DRAFT_494934 [Aspergillus brunneoviolaceus CBS 621.78]RAH46297.1 hypothetical protein BO95DRAFT_494934 [Aspergillus brunneoviolaceus CBS 621.78]
MHLVEGSRATPTTPQQDCHDLVLMDRLCVDFREKLLDALATSSCSSTFVEARNIAKEKLLDILHCIGSLSASDKAKEKLVAAEELGDALTPKRTSLGDHLPFNTPAGDLEVGIGVHGASSPADFFQHFHDINAGSLDLALSTTSTPSGATGDWPALSPVVLLAEDLAMLRQSGDLDPCTGMESGGSDEMQWWSSQGGLNDTPARLSPKTPTSVPLWPGVQGQDPNEELAPAVLDFVDLDLLVEQGEMFALTHGGHALRQATNSKQNAARPGSATLVGSNDARPGTVREDTPITPAIAHSPAPDRGVRHSSLSQQQQQQQQGIPSPSPSPARPRPTPQPVTPAAHAQDSPACENRRSCAISPVLPASSPPPQPRNVAEKGGGDALVVVQPCSEAEEAGGQPMEIDYAAALPSLTGVYCVPDHLPTADQVYAVFSQQLPNSKRQVAELFTRLFYAIGSPDALIQLRHALHLARKSSVLPVATAGGPRNDLATTVQALDQLDSITTLSHILRRYYLVRLLTHRTRLEQDHIAAKLACRGSKRMLKYDCARLQLIRDGGDGDAVRAASTAGGRRPTSKPRPKHRSKTQALTDLMQMLYPGLTPIPAESSNRSTNDCVYTRKLTRLRNRLSCARNWYPFEHTFPGGILALIPCAGRYSISIDQVEKLPSDTMRIFLAYLQEHRGTYLRSLSQALSKDVFDVLEGADLSQTFAFETVDEGGLGDYLYDTEDLLQLCKPAV